MIRRIGRMLRIPYPCKVGPGTGLRHCRNIMLPATICFTGRIACATIITAMPNPQIIEKIASLKQRYSDPRRAAKLLREALSGHYPPLIQWDKLRLVPESYTDPKRSDRETDLLFAAPLAENEAMVYMYFDLEATNPEAAADRLRSCMKRIEEKWVETHGKTRALPVILPVLMPVFMA